MIAALRTPAAYRRSGSRHDPLDYRSCRARALGLAVAYRRRLSGLGLRTAAECAKLTAGELHDIESGVATPTGDTLLALTDVYRTDLAEVGADTLRLAGMLFDNPATGRD